MKKTAQDIKLNYKTHLLVCRVCPNLSCEKCVSLDGVFTKEHAWFISSFILLHGYGVLRSKHDFLRDVVVLVPQEKRHVDHSFFCEYMRAKIFESIIEEVGIDDIVSVLKGFCKMHNIFDYKTKTQRS